MSDLSLYISLSTLADYIELAQIICTSADWRQLQAADEIDAPANADNYILLEATGSGEEEPDTVTLSLATAAAILPDLIARILRRAIEASHE